MIPPMDILEFKSVSYSYQNKIAVDGINFSIPLTGGITILLGQNGAGKTTTIKLLMGLLGADSGEIKLSGLSPREDARKFSARVGYLPEVAPLYQDLTVTEYLCFCRDIRPRIEGIMPYPVFELLQKLGLETKGNALICTLSKGMKQRVGLAQALIHRPKLLVLDEPTVGLDPQTVVLIRNFLQEVSKETTIILSTHLLAEAQILGKSFLILKDSKLIAHGPYEELQEQIDISQVYDLEVGDKCQQMNIREELEKQYNLTFSPYRMDHEGKIQFSIFSKSQTNFVPEIANYLVENKIPIFEISRRQTNLEDIFLQLNQESPGAGA